MLKRRLSFAAPFVITAVLAPGCGSKQQTPREPKDPEPQPTTNTWVKEGSTWTYHQENGDQIWFDGADGSCRLIADMGECPEGASCNPPPPRDIECPAGLPEDATAPGETTEAPAKTLQ